MPSRTIVPPPQTNQSERRETVSYDDNLQHNQSELCKADKPPTKVGKGLDPFRNCPTRQVLCFHRKYFVRALVAAGPRPSRTIVPPPQTSQSERRETVPYYEHPQNNLSERHKTVPYDDHPQNNLSERRKSVPYGGITSKRNGTRPFPTIVFDHGPAIIGLFLQLRRFCHAQS
jgi:hypothetical protein